MKLMVQQFGRKVGELESTPERGVVFRYDAHYAAQPMALPISQSLPLRDREYSQSAALPFFSGLLPDGDLRRRIADALHISDTSSLRLLEALGGECAGTISLVPELDGDENFALQESVGYQEIGLPELERMILESDRLPLLFPRGGTRLSLAGAQEKIPLLRKDGHWYKPKGSAPTSHILKLASPGFRDIVYNEYAVMRLAGLLSLSVPIVEVAVIGKPVLIVERYDRRYDAEGTLRRVHQEDCCQALGIMPDRKYQGDGGPGFSELAALIRIACSAPLTDLERLIDIALFNVLVGNCDAHGKNFSLLHEVGGVVLAPSYDLVSTTYWPELETKLSMKMGGEYKLSAFGPDSLFGLARDLGVRSQIVHKRLDRLQEAAPGAWDRVSDLPELKAHYPMLESIRAGWLSRMHRLSATLSE